MKQLAMIGAGNMGEAILKGALVGGAVKKEDVVVHANSDATNERIANTYGVQIAADNRETAQAKWILLAVKPNMYETVIDEIKDVVQEAQQDAPKTIIAIAPGFTIERIRTAFGIPNLHVLRMMPNTPAAVGKGATGIVFSENFSEDCSIRKALTAFVDSFGTHVEVKEDLMGAVGSVSGSSPAFVYMLIEALTQGAIKLGLSPKDAQKLAAATVEGAGKMVLESDKHPAQLRDEVCSPGGTTIEGVQTLEEFGFTGAIMAAMEAMAEKTKRM